MQLPAPVTVASWMNTRVVCLTPDMDVLDAIALFLERNISGAPVLDERGNLVGMLTERDCLQTAVYAGYHGDCTCGTVGQYMTPEVVSVEADSSLLDVARMLIGSNHRRYPVLEENQLVGIIGRRDVLGAVLTFSRCQC